MTTHRKLQFGEKFKVMQRLVLVCAMDADGFAVYDDGVDDHVLAGQLTEDLGFDVNASHVSQLRRLEIGNFRRVEGGAAKVKASDFAGLSERVANIEEALVSVTESLASVLASQELLNEMMADHGPKSEGLREVVDAPEPNLELVTPGDA